MPIEQKTIVGMCFIIYANHIIYLSCLKVKWLFCQLAFGFTLLNATNTQNTGAKKFTRVLFRFEHCFMDKLKFEDDSSRKTQTEATLVAISGSSGL